MKICIRLIVIYVIPLKPSRNYIYHGFNIKKSYILPTEGIYVLYKDLRKKQRLLSYRSFKDGFLYRRTNLFTARYEMQFLNKFKLFSFLKICSD